MTSEEAKKFKEHLEQTGEFKWWYLQVERLRCKFFKVVAAHVVTCKVVHLYEEDSDEALRLIRSIEQPNDAPSAVKYLTKRLNVQRQTIDQLIDRVRALEKNCCLD